MRLNSSAETILRVDFLLILSQDSPASVDISHKYESLPSPSGSSFMDLIDKDYEADIEREKWLNSIANIK